MHTHTRTCIIYPYITIDTSFRFGGKKTVPMPCIRMRVHWCVCWCEGGLGIMGGGVDRDSCRHPIWGGFG